YYTIADDELFRLIALANQTEGVGMEPSAAAGLAGMARVLGDADYIARLGYGQQQLAHATHIAWVTGGSMVPAAEMQAYLAQGRDLL
ncbi:MAG: D-serine dehydratase, partial [Neisseriaceae bacterium]|nr:D-serine dehydratase [Neisseriaceae bacterium]